jgi:CheY-like chemotaxis protein
MGRILVVDDDPHVPHMRGFDSIGSFHQRAPSIPRVAISVYAISDFVGSDTDFTSVAAQLGATRCLRKPFRPATPLNVIDECLSEAEPHRKYVATPSAVTNALSEPQRDASARGGMKAEASGR